MELVKYTNLHVGTLFDMFSSECMMNYVYSVPDVVKINTKEQYLLLTVYKVSAEMCNACNCSNDSTLTVIKCDAMNVTRRRPGLSHDTGFSVNNEEFLCIPCLTLKLSDMFPSHCTFCEDTAC